MEQLNLAKKYLNPNWYYIFIVKTSIILLYYIFGKLCLIK